MHIYAHILLLLRKFIRRHIGISTDCGLTNREEDSGIGISESDIPHIFERFYRADDSRSKQTGGSGLGLAIAKWIVERHGGSFEVVSRTDIGTRITVILPKE